VPARKYVLDANCFIDASRDYQFREAFIQFCQASAPRLYLSAVVAAELRAGAASQRDRERLEAEVLAPYVRRGRVLAPSAACWDALGTVLSAEGVRREHATRSFVFDVLIAQSCREAGAVLITRNEKDMARIAWITPFEFVAPFPVVEATGR
jgi:predicted nucleic acid-binding protein